MGNLQLTSEKRNGLTFRLRLQWLCCCWPLSPPGHWRASCYSCDIPPAVAWETCWSPWPTPPALSIPPSGTRDALCADPSVGRRRRRLRPCPVFCPYLAGSLFKALTQSRRWSCLVTCHTSTSGFCSGKLAFLFSKWEDLGCVIRAISLPTLREQGVKAISPWAMKGLKCLASFEAEVPIPVALKWPQDRRQRALLLTLGGGWLGRRLTVPISSLCASLI